tara:strand:+ start:6490 stop:6900 length:411 start_codon:yes stop_codon:yes gene_type:complete
MKRPNELQVSFYIDSKERQQFQELCKTSGISASNVLRMWIQQALQTQSLNVETPPDGRTVTNTVVASTSSETNHELAVIKKRLDKVERIFNFINETELEFIKNEVIGEDFGTIRNRVGVCESQLQQLGGSISWKED